MGTTTRLLVRKAMAKAAQMYRGSTATGGSTTTLIDTVKRKERDDTWNGSQLHKESGAGAGEIGDVTDFVRITSVLTHAQTLTASDATTVYGLYKPPFTIEDYNDAIDAALDEAYARGFARRGWDQTLYTGRYAYYALPSTIEEIAEVLMSGNSRLPDPDWFSSGKGWTKHAVASFGNNGDNQERTLDHVATQANQYSTCDVAVQPGQEYSFRVRAISVSGTPTAVARYQFLTTGGSTIGSATNFGTYQVAASGLITGTFRGPVNAVAVRIGLGSSSSSGTVRFYEHHLCIRGEYEKLARGAWGLEWEGTTGRLVFRRRPQMGRVLLIRGRRALETLAADTDTLSFDAPEIRAFVCLGLAHLWAGRQGPVPDLDGAQAETQEARWRGRFATLSEGLFDNFTQRRTIASPQWG